MTTYAGDAIRLLEKMITNIYRLPKERRMTHNVSYTFDSGLAAETRLMRQELGQELKSTAQAIESRVTSIEKSMQNVKVEDAMHVEDTTYVN